MKKVFAIILSMLLVATFCFAVVGCKKAEEQFPEEAAVEAPAPEAAPEPAPEMEPAPEAPEEAPAAN
ncbi:MAG: hypothetical protein GX147_02070 [Deltaproteobacteria bacterium]|nr:hypothetical protein [Deltaproteobacteria bacterium]